MKQVRGIRGATVLTKDDPVEMRSAVSELLTQMLSENQLSKSDLI